MFPSSGKITMQQVNTELRRPATDLKEYKSFKYIIDDKYIIDGTGEIQLWLQDKFYNTTQNREIFNYLKSKYKQKIKFRIEAIP